LTQSRRKLDITTSGEVAIKGSKINRNTNRLELNTLGFFQSIPIFFHIRK
jgi:hypothetical protein